MAKRQRSVWDSRLLANTDLIVPYRNPRWKILSGSKLRNNFSNGQTITIRGIGFGTKSSNSPTLDDHGQDGAGNVNSGWSGTWPNDAVTSVGNLKNRTAPFQALASSTIQGPHRYTTTFLAGCHTGDASRSSDVMGFLSYVPPTQPWYSYWRWRFRLDPNWWFAVGPEQQSFTGTLTNGSPTITNVSSFTNVQVGAALQGTGVAVNFQTLITAIDTNAMTITMGANATASASGSPSTVTALYFGVGSLLARDNNYKAFDFSNDIHPYDGNHNPSENWYTGIVGTTQTGSGSTAAIFTVPNSNSDTRGTFVIDDDGGFRPANPTTGAIENPDQNGHTHSWNACNNPTNVAMGEIGTGGWITAEVVAAYTTATSGYWRYYENGIQIANYAGSTVYATLAGSVSEAIGGFSRNVGAVPTDTTNFSSPAAVGTLPQWRYFADIICDRQTTGLGRFMMTNSATYSLGDGNIAEYQPYSAYANGQVTLIIRKGNLQAGTTRIWFVDEVNGVSTPVLQKTITLN